MKKIPKIIFVIFSLVFLSYLILPNPSFPTPPPDALQSNEPADTETPLRRAYFTNYSREEIMEHYKNQFIKSGLLAIPVPTYRLNYPPEESKTIIRDQTRSTFLEEIVHPFRESIFVNGFEPKEAKDAIFIGGRPWRQKIIIRHVPSKAYYRVGVAVLALAGIWILATQWRISIADFFRKARQ